MLSQKWLSIVAVLLCSLVAAGAQADLKDFTGTLEINLLGTTLQAGPISGQVDVAPDGSFDLPANLFVMLDAGTAAGISNYLYTGANLTGHFAPGASSFGGSMPISGSGYYTLVTGKSMSVQLGVVGGPVASTSVSGISNGLTGTIIGGPWRTAQTVLSTGTPLSVVTGSVSATGFDNRTAGGDGNLQLVTPIHFILDGSVSLDGTHGSFGVLNLSFVSVPEPGSALLLSAGLLGLVIAGRPRRRA